MKIVYFLFYDIFRLQKSFVSHVERILERQFRENAQPYVAVYHYFSREEQRSW